MTKSLAIVVPSNRPDRLSSFLNAWNKQTYPADWYIVFDGELEEMMQTRLPVSRKYQFFGWRDLEATGHGWIFPHKTAAIRSFGILKAFESGADYILCLDDDVLPSGPDHLAQLVAALETPVQSEWVGIGPQKQRGIPFDLEKKAPWLHEGGWYNVPDLDAPTRLVEGVDPAYTVNRALGTSVVPKGVFLALSAMHVIFRRELAPAMYQLLMGPDWGFHRFDDIWSGMFAKKVCDHLGVPVTFGSPQVEHQQASNVYNNLKAEAPGIAEHESRWRDIAAIPVSGDCATCAYQSIAGRLALFGGEYWPKLAEAMCLWASLFPCMGPRTETNIWLDGDHNIHLRPAYAGFPDRGDI